MVGGGGAAVGHGEPRVEIPAARLNDASRRGLPAQVQGRQAKAGTPDRPGRVAPAGRSRCPRRDQRALGGGKAAAGRIEGCFCASPARGIPRDFRVSRFAPRPPAARTDPRAGQGRSGRQRRSQGAMRRSEAGPRAGAPSPPLTLHRARRDASLPDRVGRQPRTRPKARVPVGESRLGSSRPAGSPPRGNAGGRRCGRPGRLVCLFASMLIVAENMVLQ